MEPGWHADPWSPSALRWWDGAQWTSHVAPLVQAYVPYREPRPTADGIAKARVWGERAKVTVMLAALASCAQLFFAATVFHNFLHNFFHQLHVQNQELERDPYGNYPIHLHFGNILWVYLLGIVTFLLQVVLMMWLWRSCKIARGVGLHQHLEPVWAFVGFIVPVVNLWFPYWIASDLFQEGDPERRHSGWWWGLWLGQGAVVAPILVISFASTPVALVLAAVCCIIPLLCAWHARQMIDAVTARQATIA